MQEQRKKWYHSKTLWANFLAFIAVLIQERTGYVVPAVWQGYGLIGINFILRWVTKEPVEWKHNGLELPKMFVGFVLCFFLLAGCAPTMDKACKELTKVHDFMIEAQMVAQAGYEKDPNLVSEDDLVKLEMMTDTIQRIQEMACELKDILPKK